MEPIRTCVACRKKAHKHKLFRFVRAVDGEICFDESAQLPSRGAWVCVSRACVLDAFKRRLLFRGEKNLPIDGAAMLSSIEARLKKKLLAQLGLGRRCGHIEAGRSAVTKIIAQNLPDAVIFAKEFAPRSKIEITRSISEENRVRTFTSSFKMDELGKSIGRKKTGVVAVMKSRITEDILAQIDKLSKIETKPNGFKL